MNRSGKFLGIVVSVMVFCFTGCSPDVQTVLGVAEAAVAVEQGNLKAINPEVSEYLGTVHDKIGGLKVLYADYKAAAATAKPGLSSQIETLTISLLHDDAQVLALVQVKNPTKLLIIQGVIAMVEAAIYAMQHEAPAPSGNPVQLNSTAAQLKAAAKQF